MNASRALCKNEARAFKHLFYIVHESSSTCTVLENLLPESARVCGAHAAALHLKNDATPHF